MATAPASAERPGPPGFTRPLAGADAALVALAMGVMYALIAYAALGPKAFAPALQASALALVVGGAVAAATGRGPVLVSGPTASGTLVLAALVLELQTLAGVRGQLEAAVFASAVALAACGALQLLLARLRLGLALKFVPFPVLAGFANTVALSLVVSMLPAALGHDFPGRLTQIGSWFTGWKAGASVVAVTGMLAGLALLRRWPRLPAVFAALLVGAVLHRLLQATGALPVGPTLPGVGAGLPAWPDAGRLAAAPLLGLAYWSMILKHGLMLAVLNSLFSLLSAARLATPMDPPVDGDGLLRAQGLANLACACCGGLPVAVLGPVTVPMRAGGPAAASTWAVYLVLLVVVFAIAPAWITWLPMAAVAGAVFIASRSLFDAATPGWMRQLLRGPRRGGVAGPLAVGALVVGVGLLQGLAAALFVGSLAASVLLAVELRRGIVLDTADGRSRRSRRVRPADEQQQLDALGQQLCVVTLGHWLYFGTADELGDVLDRRATAVRWLLLDMHRVAGIDVTAARSLAHAAQRLRSQGVVLVLAGLPPGDLRRAHLELFTAADGQPAMTVLDNLDAALERAEDALLGDATRPATTLTGLPLPGLDADAAQRLLQLCDTVTLQAGGLLFRTGDPGQALYVVRRGRMSLRVARPDAAPLRLMSFGAGVVFGEMALLDGRSRSADAVAEVPTELAVLRRRHLEVLAVVDPALHRALLQGIALHLVRRLRDTTALLVQQDPS